MRNGKLGAYIISLSTGGLLVLLAVTFAGCPNTAGDCNYTLSCETPSCADAGDDQECIPEDGGMDGGEDAQND